MSSTPQVKWYQKDTYVGLIVDAVDAKEDTVKTELTETSVHFEVETNDGKKEFDLTFDKKINPNRYKTKVKDRRIKITIGKADDCEGEWPRLTPTKLRWLKFDVDSVDLTDEETIAARKLEDAKRKLEAEHGPLPDDAKIQQISQMINVDELSRDIDEAEREMYDMVRNSYLTIYNGVMFLGYFYVFFVSVLRVVLEGTAAISTNYSSISWLLKSCQQTVALEIIHSAVGLSKNSIFSSLSVILGRGLVLFSVVEMEESLQGTLTCYFLVLAWSASELFRYPYYVTQIYELYFPRIMWLRHTMWIFLLPVGVACEAILVYQCIGLVAVSRRFTLDLPNRLNLGFDFETWLYFHFICIIPFALNLFKYMGDQRSKAMKKLSKFAAMSDINRQEYELYKIRQKKEKSK